MHENGPEGPDWLFITLLVRRNMDVNRTYSWDKTGKILEKIYAIRIILGCLLAESTLTLGISCMWKVNALTSISIHIRRWNTTQYREKEWRRLSLTKGKSRPTSTADWNAKHTRRSDHTSKIWHAKEAGSEGKRQSRGTASIRICISPMVEWIGQHMYGILNWSTLLLGVALVSVTLSKGCELHH
jgi:hypothetical protein